MEEQFTIQLMYRGSIQEIVIKVKNNATLQRYFVEEYKAYGENQVEVTRQSVKRLHETALGICNDPDDEDLILGYLPPGLEIMKEGQMKDSFYLSEIREIADVTEFILGLENIIEILLWSDWRKR